MGENNLLVIFEYEIYLSLSSNFIKYKYSFNWIVTVFKIKNYEKFLKIKCNTIL